MVIVRRLLLGDRLRHGINAHALQLVEVEAEALLADAQRGKGVHEAIQRLIAAPAGVPSQNANTLRHHRLLLLGGDLLQFVFVADIAVDRKVHTAGRRLPRNGHINAQAAVDQLLRVVGAQFSLVDLALATLREVGDWLAVCAGPESRNHPVHAMLDALGLHLVGVVAASIPAPTRHALERHQPE